jgi:hypothetical protein
MARKSFASSFLLRNNWKIQDQLEWISSVKIATDSKIADNKQIC